MKNSYFTHLTNIYCIPSKSGGRAGATTLDRGLGKGVTKEVTYEHMSKDLREVSE